MVTSTFSCETPVYLAICADVCKRMMDLHIYRIYLS